MSDVSVLLDPRGKTFDANAIFETIRNQELDHLQTSHVIPGLLDDIAYFETKDPSIIAAKGAFKGCGGIECIVIGQEKRHKEYEPGGPTGIIGYEGYIEIRDICMEAVKRPDNKMPIITLINCLGGNPDMVNEEHNISREISDTQSFFQQIETYVCSVVLDEGGSGGALGIKGYDTVLMKENSIFSVITPESCKRILFEKKMNEELGKLKAEMGKEEYEQAEAQLAEKYMRQSMKILWPTPDNLLNFGMIDGIIPEPPGGAHSDHQAAIELIRRAIEEQMREYVNLNEQKDKKTGEVSYNPRLRSSKIMGWPMVGGGVRDKRMERIRKYGHIELRDLDPRQLWKTARRDKREFGAYIPPEVPLFELKSEDVHIANVQAHVLQQLGIEPGTPVYVCTNTWEENQKVGGCGKIITVKDYEANHDACTDCGKGAILDVERRIGMLCDEGSFDELNRDLNIGKIIGYKFKTKAYEQMLERARKKTKNKEALVTGVGVMDGFDAVLAIYDPFFIGGSFGAVVGEKYWLAAEYAIDKNLPFICICTSGGARMYEGTLALAQMPKMICAADKMMDEGNLVVNWGVSYVTGGLNAGPFWRGHKIGGEKGTHVQFAGPRVVKGAGYNVDPKIVTMDHLYELGMVNAVTNRKDTKGQLVEYIGLWASGQKNYRERTTQRLGIP
ncbi:MAG: hypothetical protein KJ709_09055 [Nanoarchaeota archaeon]|nr:hypothetical protein [Nanoarchaeota archaeon]